MFRHHTFNRNDVHAILVSRLRYLGDVILTTPLLRNLRAHFPLATIAYLTETPYSEVLENNPNVDDTFVLDRRAGLRQQLQLLAQLRQQRFDLTIDLLGIPRSAIALRLTGATFRIGGNFRGRRFLYTHRVEDDGARRTAVDFHLQALEVLGLKARSYAPEVHVSPEDRAWARGYLIAKGLNRDSPLVGLHPGATWPNKMWMWERFAELAERIAADGGQILVTQGPGEELLARQVVESAPRGVVMCDLLPLNRLAALLQQVDVYVTNDSGVMHMAASVGTKTIGIFGPGEADLWFPYSEELGHQGVYAEIWCRPCHKDFCPLGTLECMHKVQVEDVYSAILKAYDTELSRTFST